MRVNRSWLANALTATVATLLAFSVCEVALRLLVPDAQPAETVSATGDPYRFYRFDPTLGWANAPLVSGTFKAEEFEHPVSINRFGMRQKDVAREKHPGVFRVAFVGDSFVWGVGVPDDERFTERVGKLTGVETLNFGASGYGPLQEYLALDRVVAFSPDLVVLVFCLNNDFEDNVLHQRYGYDAPYAELDEAGELRIKGYPLHDARELGYRASWGPGNLLGRSRLLAGARELVASLWSAAGSSGQAGLVGFTNRSLYRYPRLGPGRLRQAQEAIRINKKILQMIKAGLDRAAIGLVLVPAPTRREYHPLGRHGDLIRDTTVSDILKATAAELGLGFVDTVPLLNGNDFWKKDGHWNPGGHEKMARAVVEYLRARGYVQAGNGPRDAGPKPAQRN